MVRRCVGGDSRAQQLLYRKYVKAMYNVVLRMVSAKMDAEDVTQELFVKVFRNLQHFNGESSLGAWIKRIAINAALNHIRKNKRMKWMDLEKSPEPVEPQSLLNNDPIQHLDMKTIHVAIRKLPEGCRVVFNLYLLEGYQHKEIAQLLDISESTSKTQYRRAKQLLRQRLKSPYVP